MLARKSLLAFLVNLVGAGGGMVGLFFIARYMTPEAYGMFGFAFSVGMLASKILNAGLHDAHVKRLNEGADPADCLATFGVIKIGLTGLFLVLFLGGAWWWDQARGFYDATSLPVLVAVAALMALQSLQAIPAQTFNALRQTARSQSLNLLEHAVKVPLTVAVALLFGTLAGRWVPFGGAANAMRNLLGLEGPWSDATGAALLALAWAVAMLVSTLAGFWYLRRFGFRWGRYRPALARHYGRFATPLAIGSGLALMAGKVDVLMLGYFWTSTEVGHYFAAQRAIVVLMVVPQIVRSLFFPLISEVATFGDNGAVRELATTAQRLLTLTIMPASAAVAALAVPATIIFLSRAYLPAAPVLAMLSLTVVIASISSVSRSIVKGLDRPRVVLQGTILSMTLNVGLNAWLIPQQVGPWPGMGLGAVGAAIATVLSGLVALTWMVFQHARLAGGHAFSPATGKHLVAAGAIFFLGRFTVAEGWFWGMDRWFTLGPAIAFLALVYLGILVAWREVGRKDLLLLQDLAHPGRMAKYVRDELRGQR